MYVFSILLDAKAAWLGRGQLNLPGCIRLTTSVSGRVQRVEDHVVFSDISTDFVQSRVPTAAFSARGSDLVLWCRRRGSATPRADGWQKGTIVGVFFNPEPAVESLCPNLWASEQQRLMSLLHLSSSVGFYGPLSLPVAFFK